MRNAMMPISTRMPVQMRPWEPMQGKPEREPIGRPIERLPLAEPMKFKKGGKVKKTGWAVVHKGERVIPAAARAMGGPKKRNKKTPKTPRAKAKIKKTMGEWKSGTLHSGSKKGPVVKSQKQAVAIALSQARRKT